MAVKLHNKNAQENKDKTETIILQNQCIFIYLFIFFNFRSFFFKDVWNICGGIISAIVSKRPWITKVLE